MPIDIFADDNESQIRFLAERVDSLNEQVELLLEAITVLGDRVKSLENVTQKIVTKWGGDDANA